MHHCFALEEYEYDVRASCAVLDIWPWSRAILFMRLTQRPRIVLMNGFAGAYYHRGSLSLHSTPPCGSLIRSHLTLTRHNLPAFSLTPELVYYPFVWRLIHRVTITLVRTWPLMQVWPMKSCIICQSLPAQPNHSTPFKVFSLSFWACQWLAWSYFGSLTSKIHPTSDPRFAEILS